MIPASIAVSSNRAVKPLTKPNELAFLVFQLESIDRQPHEPAGTLQIHKTRCVAYRTFCDPRHEKKFPDNFLGTYSFGRDG